jgi:predicted nucleic acid-binding Zn ribbon protein
MANTLLRLGLWILILVLALYVLESTYSEQHWTELIPAPMLVQAMVLAVVLIIVGVILRILGVGARAVSKNRCRVCRTPIPPGAIYCRAHLRTILHEEDDKTHASRIRR